MVLARLSRTWGNRVSVRSLDEGRFLISSIREGYMFGELDALTVVFLSRAHEKRRRCGSVGVSGRTPAARELISVFKVQTQLRAEEAGPLLRLSRLLRFRAGTG